MQAHTAQHYTTHHTTPHTQVICLQAYLTVGPSIAAFPEHRGALVEHLLLVKLRHWERSACQQAVHAGACEMLPAQS